jgi:hypothetical protein
MRLNAYLLSAIIAAAGAMPGFARAAANSASESAERVSVASTSCRQAVSQSRLVCLSGSNCQREISPILRTCNQPQHASCAAAREDLRAQCAPQSPWYGSRECEDALRQVSHYCGQ